MLLTKFYRVSIPAAGLINSGTSSGFIDDKSYRDWAIVSLPATAAAGLAKARGNYRWTFLMSLLNLRLGNIAEIRAIKKVGYSPNDSGTLLEFTVGFSESLPMVHTNEHGTFTGADAVKAVVVDAISATHYRNLEVYNPENQPGNFITIQNTEIGGLVGVWTTVFGLLTVAEVVNM